MLLERILKKYADKTREKFPNLPVSVYPHMIRRTRATGLYRDGVPLEVIAEMLGHQSIVTTRKHYAKPSPESLELHLQKGTEVIPEFHEEGDEIRLWENDAEFAKFVGLK